MINRIAHKEHKESQLHQFHFSFLLSLSVFLCDLCELCGETVLSSVNKGLFPGDKGAESIAVKGSVPASIFSCCASRQETATAKKQGWHCEV